MGTHYRANTDGGSLGFLKAIWDSARWCNFVEPNEGTEGEDAAVLFFRNRNKLGLPPMNDEVAVKYNAQVAASQKILVMSQDD